MSKLYGNVFSHIIKQNIHGIIKYKFIEFKNNTKSFIFSKLVALIIQWYSTYLKLSTYSSHSRLAINMKIASIDNMKFLQLHNHTFQNFFYLLLKISQIRAVLQYLLLEFLGDNFQ